MPPKISRVKFFEKAGITFNELDCVQIKGEGEEKPFIAKIRAIETTANPEDFKLNVTWYYRPEDSGIPGGRKLFHGERELYDSDHKDTCMSSTILGKCTVHSLAEYTALQRVAPTDFYSRFRYATASQRFIPEKVAVYCTCQLPENPDLPMVECEQCAEWYHLRCMGLDPEEDLAGFVCAPCRARPQGSDASAFSGPAGFVPVAPRTQ